MKSYFEQVKDKIDNYKHLGEQLLSDGTQLIGKAPHIAPMAWLHTVHPPLTNDHLKKIEVDTGYNIPDDYKFFLSHYTNGLHLFVGVFNLDGLRKRNSRSIEDAFQPYSIITPNKEERPDDAEEDMFFIGSYNWDGSMLYMKEGKVYRCLPESVTPLNSWNSFAEMIVSEVNRICLMHDKSGMRIDKSIPTTP